MRGFSLLLVLPNWPFGGKLPFLVFGGKWPKTEPPPAAGKTASRGRATKDINSRHLVDNLGVSFVRGNPNAHLHAETTVEPPGHPRAFLVKSPGLAVSEAAHGLFSGEVERVGKHRVSALAPVEDQAAPVVIDGYGVE